MVANRPTPADRLIAAIVAYQARPNAAEWDELCDAIIACGGSSDVYRYTGMVPLLGKRTD